MQYVFVARPCTIQIRSQTNKKRHLRKRRDGLRQGVKVGRPHAARRVPALDGSETELVGRGVVHALGDIVESARIFVNEGVEEA